MATKWTPKSLERRIKPHAQKWARVFALDSHWDITFEVADESSHQAAHGFSPSFQVHSDYKYLSACITAFGPVVAEMTDDEIEKAICHEYTHIMLNELACCVDAAKYDAEERVTSSLTASFIAARDMGREKKL